MIRVQPGGPADRAGVRAYDSILKIDDRDTADLPAGDAVALIRGEPGSTVELVIQSLSGKSRTLTLERAIIPVETVRGYQLREDGAWDYSFPDLPHVGYFWIEAFGENSAQELQQAIEAFPSPLEAIVIDLRGNGGGLLETAIEMCDLFIESGEIVAVKGRDERVVRRFVATSSEVVPHETSIWVIIDGFSASASEIFAACLQDHQRATIVGERSYGKGTVQHVIELEGGRSALRLTTATYWRPSGENIHRLRKSTEDETWGVSPDSGYELILTGAQREEVAAARLRRFRAWHPDVEREEIDLDPQLQRVLKALQASVAEPASAHAL